MSKLEIEYRKTSELVPYQRNSRKHPEQQINAIIKSIEKNGFTSVIVIDDKNTVLSGHGRLEAAKRLCIDELPCKVVEGWTDAQKKAYIISDNQLALMSEWDEYNLEVELISIANDGIDISDIGFDDKFLSKLFDDSAGITIDDEIDDEIEGEFKVVFPEDKRIIVMNAVADAISDIKGAAIWCETDE